MAGAGVLTFTDENFESDVLASDRPVLVDFWAPWCGPCRMISPTIDELGREAGERFRIGKLNIDDSPYTPSKYGIDGIPTLLVFKGGEIVQRFTGVTGKDELQKALEAAL